MTCVISGQQV